MLEVSLVLSEGDSVHEDGRVVVDHVEIYEADGPASPFQSNVRRNQTVPA